MTLEKTLKNALKTTDKIEWEVIKESGDTAVLLVNVGKQNMITDMDIDMAINDPSRLNKKDRRKRYKVKVKMIGNNFIILSKKKVR